MKIACDYSKFLDNARIIINIADLTRHTDGQEEENGRLEQLRFWLRLGMYAGLQQTLYYPANREAAVVLLRRVQYYAAQLGPLDRCSCRFCLPAEREHAGQHWPSCPLYIRLPASNPQQRGFLEDCDPFTLDDDL